MPLDTNTLYTLSRDGAEEIRVCGELIAVTAGRVVFHSRGRLGTYPARSLLKPFQFIAGGLPLAAWRHQEKYAACLGSTAGTPSQIHQVREWDQSPERSALVGFAKVPDTHFCHSKHMGILEACALHGWDPKSYTSPKHLYHQRLMKRLSEWLNADLASVISVTDGCSLPSPVLEISQMAELYRQLAAAESGTELAEARQLMLAYPEWIGGPKTSDCELMKLNPGKLVAKDGADGLMGIGMLPTREYPKGLGVIVKLEMGYQPARAVLALKPLLESLGLKVPDRKPEGQTIQYAYEPFSQPSLKVIDISPAMSEKIGHFPEDTPFKRTMTLSREKGDVITLSSIQSTLHAGAHADAPNHFEAHGKGIDAVAVQKYIGPVQVVEVSVPPRTNILPRHLEHTAIRSPRVILKTNSHPNPHVFDSNFSALSPELVDYLGKKGVVLVGIDTPSIDLSDSKDLPSHHSTLAYEMAILENLFLKDVRPGDYELIAVPLRIQGADASPVRAVLILP